MNPETNQNQSDERRSASWDIKNAAGNYLSLVVTQFGSAFFAFAAVWLISKQIGSEGYGGVVAIIAASQVAQILVNWTSHAVVRFGTEEFVETAKIARAFWTRTIIMVPNILLILAASNLWFPPLAGWLRLPPETFWLVIAHFVASAIWIHIQFALQGAKLPRVQGVLLMLERMSILAALVVLSLEGPLDPLLALVAYTIGPIFASIVGIAKIRRYVFSRFDLNKEFVRRVAVYSLPLLPWAVVGYFTGSYLDAVFLSGFLTKHDLGIYSLASQVNGMVQQIPTLANSLLIPLFVTLQSENVDARRNQYFEHVIPLLTLLVGLALPFVSVAFGFLLPVVFGSDFSEASVTLWILMSSTVVAIPAFAGYSALTHSISATYITMWAAIVGASVNVAGNLYLIPRYGIEGCAWATVACYFSSFVVTNALLRRRAEISSGWVYIAFVPNLVASLAASFYGNLLVALTLNTLLSAVVLIVFWSSFVPALAMLNSFKEFARRGS